MIEQSQSIAKLAAALVQVQATVEGAVKGKANPAFKGTKYADLSSVWEACREQLCTNGLTVVQFPGEMVENRMTMTTQLSHESGEWMRGTLSIPLSKVDAQGYGSAVTYARRYALAAVVGVCPEDDDGNAASRQQSRPENNAAPISDDQRQMLMTMATQAGVDARDLADRAGVTQVKDIPAAKFAAAKGWLERQMSTAGKGGSNGATH